MKKLFRFFRNYFEKIDGMLLLFLVLFLHVKLVVKLAALLVFFLLSYKKMPAKEFFRQRFSWFYLGMAGIALVNLMLDITSVTLPYLALTAAGIGFWLICLGAAWVIYQFVKARSTEKLHATLNTFFLLNALVTFGQLLLIMWDAGSINPYTYQGMNQKYFIGTGDLLRGISFDVSTTNAILNAFAVLYFLSRQQTAAMLTCMGALLLTASNFNLVLLMIILVFLFLFRSSRVQKSMILLCTCLLVIFLGKISPQNTHYIKYIYQKLTRQKIDTIPPDIGKPLLSSLPDSILDPEQRQKKFAMLYLDSLQRQEELHPLHVSRRGYSTNPGDPGAVKSKPTLPVPNIHTEPYQRKKDTTELQRQLIEFAVTSIPAFNTSLERTQQQVPGKLMAFKQSFSYLAARPSSWLSGLGTGQFASKLAFRATGMNLAGGYPASFVFISDAFRDNHLNLYLEYFSKDMEIHSLVNSPDSVYDQLLAEYGLFGLLAFLLLYAGYFTRGIHRNCYALPLLLLMGGIFFTGYWFEQLSVVILFELLMLVSQKENRENSIP